MRASTPESSSPAAVTLGHPPVRITHPDKPFWPQLGITKGELVRYYAAVAPYLLPHLQDRAMVMKRFPHGAFGPFFFMKRVPMPHPAWLQTVAVEHASGSVIDFPMVQDLSSLLWVINLGCIDLNPWYARADDVHRPDYLHFDLDPGQASFSLVVECALILRDLLNDLNMRSVVKTSGSKGLHVYVPIVRAPTQKEVWSVAKTIARELAERHPSRMTAEYRVAKRPAGRVLVDYNQNAWGRTLASVYSVRPTPGATVSTPVTWAELEQGARIEDFHLRNVPERLAAVGDLWEPLLRKTGRFELRRFV